MKKLITIFALLIFPVLSLVFLSATAAYAQILNDPCNNTVRGRPEICDSADPGTNASGLLGQDSAVGAAIHILSLAAGIIGVIMLIIGGLKYVTSGGDSSKTSSARNTILYAIVGLVVASVAQLIIIFILDKL